MKEGRYDKMKESNLPVHDCTDGKIHVSVTLFHVIDDIG